MPCLNNSQISNINRELSVLVFLMRIVDPKFADVQIDDAYNLLVDGYLDSDNMKIITDCLKRYGLGLKNRSN